ncbi:Plant basic secretory protein (BSP) family protein [Euphorbia peplus]|nr:Plant basic secretory protein (BSP) family protein [Euphorbia peplus]
MAGLFFIFLYCFLAALTGTQAVEYTVANRASTTPGGIVFDNQLGPEYTKQTMTSATDFIWRLFQQNSDAERKKVTAVSLFLDDREEDYIAAVSNDVIIVGDNFVEKIQGENIKRDFNGVVYHEMAHVWQFDGSSGTKAPGGLIEGIADFVRLKANYIPGGWAQPGDGTQWDEGYSVTARFLEYCNDVRNGFVAEINKKLRDTYSVSFFDELLGKPVEQLWSEYKAKYGKN